MRNWYCPNCTNWATTHSDKTPHHICSGNNQAGGLLIPLIEVGVPSKLTLNEREDYVGSEDVQLTEDGVPYMSASVETSEGQGLTIYVPTAHGGGHSGLV